MLQDAASQSAPDQDVEAQRTELLENANALESVSGPVGHGGHRLSAQQRLWAQYFVLTGGNSYKAAVLADYASPSTSAHKCLVNASVMAEVRRLCVSNVQSFLPIAIRTLVDVCCDVTADARARVQAASALLDRGGLKPKSDGPAVQVNVQVNGASAQAAIAEVWERKRSREERREALDAQIGSAYESGRIRHVGKLSGIGDDMPDISGVTIDAEPAAPAPAAGTPRGGAERQGPVPGHVSIPPPSSEHSPSTPESLFDD
ncbi:hypothetical protein [Sphingomonas baiyangensis]|uniref:Terminase small subunit n=1 Tax=Sphingomonas baiyangensis TaxID=2572576 RepID=A0A4U1L170_9SPHN|nr:hypothetical protein [Sphingomonas baiyangensis]TKD50567.1 hypothetical protein FBR43_07160 [Sphingomonas baiyangensis]